MALGTLLRAAATRRGLASSIKRVSCSDLYFYQPSRVFSRGLAGSGRIAHVGPSFGGAGMKTLAMYGIMSIVGLSFLYLIVFIGIVPWLGELRFELVQRYPWLDEKDPDEMD